MDCCDGSAAVAENEVRIDPVCGMKVDPAKAAAHVHYAGKEYSFCAGSPRSLRLRWCSWECLRSSPLLRAQARHRSSTFVQWTRR
jgi:hypothetical protein